MKYFIILTIFIIGLTFISLLSTSNQFTLDAATFDNSLLPGADNIYDLGFDSSPRWQDAALSGNLLVRGNVSIGTTTPSEKLTVVDGNITQTLSSTTTTRIGTLSFNNVPINSVYVSGNYAYIGTDASSQEFSIVDISNPRNPTLISALDFVKINAVYVSGKYAYIGLNSGTNRFRIIDISNPKNPTSIGTLSNLSAAVRTVYVSGKYAYVGMASTTDEFRIIDISNPTTPIQIGSFNVNNTIYSIYVSGKYAYLGLAASATNDEFTILDISNPKNPSLIGTRSTVAIGSIYVSGRYAYLGMRASSTNEFRIFDISNPSAPTFINGLNFTDDSSSTIRSIYVSGKYAYVGTNAVNNGLRIIDISSSTNPVQVGISNYYTGTVSSIYVSGKYAYLGTDSGSQEFSIIDISGFESVSANIHSLEAGNLQVRNDIIAQGQLQVTGGINVGTGGIFSAGPIGISISSTTQIDAISAYFQGRVGIATTTPTQKLEVNGGVRLFTGDTKPNCDVTDGPKNRGTLWFMASSSAPENKDTFEVCAKDGGDAYDWRQLY